MPAATKRRSKKAASVDHQTVTPVLGSVPLSVDVDVLWQQVKYAALLLESEVTEPALLALAAEVLATRKKLPVGEIGKLLQEATANQTLSATLKERFGGLKRFLERHPHVFLIAKG